MQIDNNSILNIHVILSWCKNKIRDMLYCNFCIYNPPQKSLTSRCKYQIKQYDVH